MTIKINGTNTAASPAITGTDTDTGIVYGSDQIDFSTGGSSKVTLNGSNLGIGTTSPSQQLTMANSGDSKINIKGHGSSTGYFVGMSSATDAQVWNAENGYIQFATNDAEKMRLDSNGRLLLGTDSSAGTATNLKLQAFNPSNGAIIIGSSNVSASGDASINFAPSNKITGAQIICTAEEDFSSNANRTARLGFFYRKNGTISEGLRISTEGTVFIGPTSESSITNGSAAGFQFLTSGNGQSISTTSTGFKYQMRFYNPNGQVGYISTQNSATNFNTSSDYRLKENVTAISDGITRLKTLKPSRFNFKVDKDTTVDGFLAHEVTAVPEAISGTKDEVVTQAMIDAGDYKEGTLNDPIYQGIDQSKLVPLLTAALQEAITKIETLEAKVAALEAA